MIEIHAIGLISICLIFFTIGIIYESWANQYNYKSGKLKKTCDKCHGNSKKDYRWI